MKSLKPQISYMLWVLAVCLAAALSSFEVRAQSDVPRVEIGGHVSVLKIPEKGLLFDTTTVGGGGRITFNINPGLAVEGEFNYYPEINSSPIIIESPGYTGLFGVKAGWRGEKAGIFGKLRPGFLHFREELDPNIVFINPPPMPDNPHFALDVGGVVEFYPSRRWVVRFDVGDTIVRFRYTSPFFGDRQFTSHNLQVNAGIGFRFR